MCRARSRVTHRDGSRTRRSGVTRRGRVRERSELTHVATEGVARLRLCTRDQILAMRSVSGLGGEARWSTEG